MIDSFIKNTEPRIIVLLLASILILTLLASYLYLFKKPVQLLKKNEQTLRMLKTEIDRNMPIGQMIEDLEQQEADINRLVNASGQQLPQNQMIAYVIGQLDVIAARNNVQLVSVSPGKASEIFMFEELPFSIEVTGSYFDLYNWLKKVEEKLGPMVVKSFNIVENSNDGLRRMHTVIVAYLSQDDV